VRGVFFVQGKRLRRCNAIQDCKIIPRFQSRLRFFRYVPDEILQGLDAVVHICEVEGVIVCQPTMLENLYHVLALRASAQCRDGFGFVFDVLLSNGSEASNNLPGENLIVT
jgi:hypothetical protein